MKMDVLYKVFLNATGISTDTRTIEQGQLFFALQGDNFDGNQYAEMALNKGAIAAVVSSEELVGDKYICVQDTLETLQKLARYHRDQFDIPIVGLTGSNGKTTTKELLAKALSTSFHVLATEGNLNNHIGVPLTLLRLKNEHEIAIIEMGANHLHEIDSYCHIANPTHGVITNIGLAHIGEFGGEENILKAKSELFDYVLNNQGYIFFDENESKLSSYQLNKHSVMSTSHSSEFRITCIQASPHIQFEILCANARYTGSSYLGGKYNFQNIALALTVSNFFSCPINPMVQAIGSYISSNKRSQIVKTGRNVIYLDAYNANPSSMKLAVEYFLGLDRKQNCLILGDMKELGNFSEEEHKKILSFLNNNSSKYVQYFLVGDEFMKLGSKNTFRSVQELIASNVLDEINGSDVFIKGSRSICLEKVVDYL